MLCHQSFSHRFCTSRGLFRTYAPLLEAYAGLDGRLEDCLAVWRDAVSPPTGVQMTEREYLHLIAACTRARDEKR